MRAQLYEVSEILSIEANSFWRAPAVEGSPGVQNLDHILRNGEREISGLKRCGCGLIATRLRSKRAIVGQDQIYILAVAKQSEDLEAVNRGQIVGFETQIVIIILSERFIGDLWRVVTVDSPCMLLLSLERADTRTMLQRPPPCASEPDAHR